LLSSASQLILHCRDSLFEAANAIYINIHKLAPPMGKRGREGKEERGKGGGRERRREAQTRTSCRSRSSLWIFSAKSLLRIVSAESSRAFVANSKSSDCSLVESEAFSASTRADKTSLSLWMLVSSASIILFYWRGIRINQVLSWVRCIPCEW
jgi:hypothetical protein